MRPYVICHMTTSIDGKVTGDFLYREACAPAIEEYYRLNREIPAEAFACGRVTMEGSKPLFEQSSLRDFILKEAKAISDGVLYLRYLQRRTIL